MHSYPILCVTILTVSLWMAVPGVFAQTNSSWVVDGGGAVSSNATFRNISAIAQGGPPGYNQSAANLNYSGFLNTFLLAPNLDTDNDGIADENDPDDDGDELTDTEELAGGSFDPTAPTDPLTADTDQDGAPDGDEAVAGTDPLDVNSLLTITFLSTDGADDIVEWQSRAPHAAAAVGSRPLRPTGGRG